MTANAYWVQLFLNLAACWLVLAALSLCFWLARKTGERLAAWLFPRKLEVDSFVDQWAIAFKKEEATHGACLWQDESWGRPLTQPQREQLTRWLEASVATAIPRYVEMRAHEKKYISLS